MNNINQPAFAPLYQGTVSLAVTSVTGRVQVQAAHNARHVRIFNSGSVIAFIEMGPVAVTASTTLSMPIGPGEDVILSCPCQYVAAITIAGATTLYLTPGEGL